ARRTSATRGQTRGRHESRAIHVHQDESGMVLVHGRLDPETGSVFMRALEAAQDALYRRHQQASRGSLVAPPVPTFPQRTADAWALLAETALNQGLGRVHMEPSWKVRTFPRKRRSDSVVTPAAQSCGMTRTDMSSRQVPGAARSRRRYLEHSCTATKCAR